MLQEKCVAFKLEVCETATEGGKGQVGFRSFRWVVSWVAFGSFEKRVLGVGGRAGVFLFVFFFCKT